MLVMFIWLIERDYKKYFLKIIQTPLLLAVILFASFELLTFLWTYESYYESENYLRNYALWFSIPILVLNVKKEYIGIIITAFLLGMLISEITAYGMYFELWTVKGRGADYPSPYMHHTIYALFLAFSSMILLNRVLSKNYQLKEKFFMSIFFITLSGNLFISLGRMGQIAYITSILVMGIMHFKMNFKTLFIFLTLITFILSLAYNFSPMFQKRIAQGVEDIEKISNNNLNSSWGTRVAFIILGTDIIKDNVLYGVGIGDCSIEAKRYLDKGEYNFSENLNTFLAKRHFHNQYLMLFVQSGLIGFLLFLLMFYRYFNLAIKDNELKKLSIIFPIIFLIGCISEPFFLVAQSHSLYILFTTIFLVSAKEA
jgi:O-antigen ligase